MAEPVVDGAAATATSADPVDNTTAAEVSLPEVTPNHTLYLNNLNERVKKEELKKGLYALFSQFGSILEINVSSAFRLRGQAWIVFKDVPSATKAMRDLQGFMFFDKQMRIQFAKEPSDPIAKIEGRDIDKDDRRSRKRQRDQEFLKEKTAKKPATKARPSGGSAPKPRNEPPNAILFVENLPELANDKMLTALFSQYPGFKEVRMVPGKLVAFVEYENEVQSTVAMSGLQLFKMSAEHSLVISYAKR